MRLILWTSLNSTGTSLLICEHILANVIADLDYMVNDTLGTVVSVDAEIEPGSIQLNQPAHGFFEIPVNQDIMEPGGTIHVTLYVNTNGAVEFTGRHEGRKISVSELREHN